jgi:hypothetical protein
MQYWSELVTPQVLTVFGGEPMMHPRILDVCRRMRELWPTSTIRLITNGYFLDRVPADAWFEFAPMQVQVSIHRADHAANINQRIKQILKQRSGWQVFRSDRSGHEQWSWEIEGFRLYKSIFKDFVTPYREVGATLMPWHSDPREAHSMCGAPDTTVLYRGKLYKCPAVANAIDYTGVNWFDYSACEGAETLNNFVSTIGQPESVCAQCPDRKRAVIVDHFDINNVEVKQKNIG